MKVLRVLLSGDHDERELRLDAGQRQASTCCPGCHRLMHIEASWPPGNELHRRKTAPPRRRTKMAYVACLWEPEASDLDAFILDHAFAPSQTSEHPQATPLNL